LILAFFVDTRPKTKIQFNGREHASAHETPLSFGERYDPAVDDPPALHSGARLAAKLKAKIIVNDIEFNHAGEMSVDHRHLYHEALEALFPPGIALSISEQPRKTENKKLLLIVTVASVLVGAVYLCLRALFS